MLNLIVLKGKHRFIDPKNLDGAKIPTIFEDENESAISSKMANPKEFSSKSIEMPLEIRPRSQTGYISSSANADKLNDGLYVKTGMELDPIDSERISKQNTPLALTK